MAQTNGSPAIQQTSDPLTERALRIADSLILVVDDHMASLRQLTGVLKEVGYRVHPLPSGAMALEAASKLPIDLVLLDVGLSVTSGFDVCRSLQIDPRTADVPVIFISEYDEVLDKLMAFGLGGTDYVTKPFHVEEILARVQTHLALRHSTRQLQQAKAQLEDDVRERTAMLEALSSAASHFVPRETIELLGKDSLLDVHLGDGKQLEMAVMFADVRSFTTLAEAMTPEESFAFLNQYFGYVSPIIRENHGLIDQYIGDGITALFPQSVEHAIAAGIEIQQKLQQINQRQKQQGKPLIQAGFSIHAGPVRLGIVGDEQRFQSTVISDVVNTAGRMQQVNKDYGAPLVLSEQALKMLEDRERYAYRFLNNVQVKGKSQAIFVYELLEPASDPSIQSKRMTQTVFGRAVRHFARTEYSEALRLFEKIIERHPEDEASLNYMQRCYEHINHPALSPFPDKAIGLERGQSASEMVPWRNGIGAADVRNNGGNRNVPRL